MAPKPIKGPRQDGQGKQAQRVHRRLLDTDGSRLERHVLGHQGINIVVLGNVRLPGLVAQWRHGASVA
jgi:hypothetical protein